MWHRGPASCGGAVGRTGFHGKWVLHPDQVAAGNEICSPDQDEWPPSSAPPVSSRCTLLHTGARVDLEAGMAKLFGSDTAMQLALDPVRIHGAR